MRVTFIVVVVVVFTSVLNVFVWILLVFYSFSSLFCLVSRSDIP